VSKAAITERNRANASQSTGPKTAQGKAVVSRNTVQHGATAKPDPDTVAIWLRNILNVPDAMLIGAFGESEVFLAAYHLAETEVQLIAAEHALSDFEIGEAAPSEECVSLDDQMLDVFDMLEFRQMTRGQRRIGLTLIARMKRAQIKEIQDGGPHHKLLKRHFGEARSQRRKAFSAWIAVLSAGHLDKRTEQCCMR
jgi:hypothetical protein